MHPLTCIAHRGGPVHHQVTYPENSLAAIKASLALGVDAIEIDVWALHGKLFVTHDRRLGRVINGQGLISDKTLSELLALTLSNQEPLPTLDDILQIIDTSTLLNIEIKGEHSSALLAATLENFCNQYQRGFEQFLVSSFDHQQLREFKQLLPKVRIGALIEGIPHDLAACCSTLNAWSLNAHAGFLSSKLIADAKARGMKIFIYTVNHLDDLQRLSKMGVDGVFTDNPALVQTFNQGLNR